MSAPANNSEMICRAFAGTNILRPCALTRPSPGNSDAQTGAHSCGGLVFMARMRTPRASRPGSRRENRLLARRGFFLRAGAPLGAATRAARRLFLRPGGALIFGAARLLVDGAPRALLRFLFANATFFVALLDVFGLSFLLRRIFAFAALGHGS